MAGRPKKLDDGALREIISLLSVGGSRADAARYVGCAIGTIYNTMHRNAEFASQVRRAETSVEVNLLRNFRDASSRSWRAAAWQLEHLNPQRYARRLADYLTFSEMEKLVIIYSSEVCQCVPLEMRPAVVERLAALEESLTNLAATEPAHRRRRLLDEILARHVKMRGGISQGE